MKKLISVIFVVWVSFLASMITINHADTLTGKIVITFLVLYFVASVCLTVAAMRSAVKNAD